MKRRSPSHLAAVVAARPAGEPYAHRGYLVRRTAVGEVFVEKGGTLICWARDDEDARAQIDALTTEEL